MKVGQIGPTLLAPEKTVNFFWGQTCCTLFHTKNEEKSQKISTCIRLCAYTHAYTSAGTLQLNNFRIIRCLISFIRLAGFNRSRYIGSAGKAQV